MLVMCHHLSGDRKMGFYSSAATTPSYHLTQMRTRHLTAMDQKQPGSSGTKWELEDLVLSAPECLQISQSPSHWALVSSSEGVGDWA